MTAAFDGERVKALVFDVFGTVVDWRGSIITAGAALTRDWGLALDWDRFADAWRATYGPSMNRVRRGEIGWQNLDSLHRTSLEEVLGEFGVRGLREAQKEQLTRLWHRLHGWPDATPGLTRLKARFIIAPCSNGNVALIVNMAKHAGLPWDCVLGAELAHAYKPDRIVYETAAGLLGLPCEQVLMVAAHGGDLRAAAAAGLRTAYIPRPLEHGPEHAATFVPERGFDIAANDLTDLAARLGA